MFKPTPMIGKAEKVVIVLGTYLITAFILREMYVESFLKIAHIITRPIYAWATDTCNATNLPPEDCIPLSGAPIVCFLLCASIEPIRVTILYKIGMTVADFIFPEEGTDPFDTTYVPKKQQARGSTAQFIKKHD